MNQLEPKRLWWRTIATVAVFLLPTFASAATTTKERSGGGGGPGAAPGGGAGGGGGEAGVTRDVHGNLVEWDPNKPWYATGTYEFHHLIRQNDLGGDAPNKNLNFLYFDVGWDFTKNDRVYGRFGFYERFVADQGETGLRFDDAFVAYQRRVDLPENFLLRIIPRIGIPLSFESHKQRTIVAPRLTVALDKTLGLATFEALFYGEAYLNGSTTGQDAANPNPRSVLATLWSAEVAMPFHRPLSFGIEGYLASVGYYDPSSGSLDNTGLKSSMGGQQPGTSADPNYGSDQPRQASYGGELYARYILPEWKHFFGDLKLAYANGDSTIGYQGLRHDGVARVNLFYRHVAEVYFAFTARY